MSGHNEPREFVLTPENFLDILMEWMPEQLQRMRLYQSGPIHINEGITSLECQYMQTVGGEKFRIVQRSPFGDSTSAYYASLGEDDDIIIAFAQRIERSFDYRRKVNKLRGIDDPIVLTMTFVEGHFDLV